MGRIFLQFLNVTVTLCPSQHQVGPGTQGRSFSPQWYIQYWWWCKTSSKTMKSPPVFVSFTGSTSLNGLYYWWGCMTSSKTKKITSCFCFFLESTSLNDLYSIDEGVSLLPSGWLEGATGRSYFFTFSLLLLSVCLSVLLFPALKDHCCVDVLLFTQTNKQTLKWQEFDSWKWTSVS